MRETAHMWKVQLVSDNEYSLSIQWEQDDVHDATTEQLLTNPKPNKLPEKAIAKDLEDLKTKIQKLSWQENINREQGIDLVTVKLPRNTV